MTRLVLWESRLADIWRILCIHLGTPPEKFDWQWEDKDGKLHRRMMTPLEFADEFVEIDWEDYVCIINDQNGTTKPTLLIICKMLLEGTCGLSECSKPGDERYHSKLLEDGLPVWMGCDVGNKCTERGGFGTPSYSISEPYTALSLV